MINKRTKKTSHLHFTQFAFAVYVCTSSIVQIYQKITNKRTDKSDCLHFAIISPGSMCSDLSKIITKKERTKVTAYILHPVSFQRTSSSVYTFSISKELLTNEVAKIIIKYVSRDWSEIVWLPEISRFKINLAISFIRKKTCWNTLVRL